MFCFIMFSINKHSLDSIFINLKIFNKHLNTNINLYTLILRGKLINLSFTNDKIYQKCIYFKNMKIKREKGIHFPSYFQIYIETEKC